MFTNHDEADQRKRVSEPDPADAPYYLSGEPTQAQWITFWKARALIAEAEVKRWRELAAATKRRTDQ